MAKAYQERLIALVKDTISLLCKNGLEYNQEFCVEGLLGVTLDKDEVFLIPIKELVADKGVGTTSVADEASLDTHSHDEGRMSPKRERKKKRRHAEATVTRDESDYQYEAGSSSLQFETGPSEWESESKSRVTDQTDQETEHNDTDNQPSSKRQREERRAQLSNVKAEDIVVIKEEVDEEDFADAFQDGSLDDSTFNPTNPGDTSMAFFPPPGTSQSSMNFSIDQLTGGQGLSGANVQGLPAGAEGDASWLQQSPGDMQGQEGDWQGQKHQVCIKLRGFLTVLASLDLELVSKMHRIINYCKVVKYLGH